MKRPETFNSLLWIMMRPIVIGTSIGSILSFAIYDKVNLYLYFISLVIISTICQTAIYMINKASWDLWNEKEKLVREADIRIHEEHKKFCKHMINNYEHVMSRKEADYLIDVVDTIDKIQMKSLNNDEMLDVASKIVNKEIK